MNASLLRPVAAALLLTLVAACRHSDGGSTVSAPTVALPQENKLAEIPLGDLAGAAASTLASTMPNPYHGKPEAVEQGARLFRKMNCASCHGYTAEGAMGPDLTDTYWRYGGTPAEIYKSIYEGRPQGMPAWGKAMPPQEIWQLVAYIESLGGSFAADRYQAARQGDQPGENIAPEAQGTPVETAETKSTEADASTSQPSGSASSSSDASAGAAKTPDTTTNR